MRHSGTSLHRAVVGTALALALVGCGGSGQEAADPTSSPSVSVQSSPTADATQSSQQDDEAAVRAVLKKYWNIYVRSQNKVITDPDQYNGVARGSFVEANLAAVQNYQEFGNRRVGRPEISPPTIAVDGDKATAVQCIDVSEWGVRVPDGTVSYPPGDGPTRSRAHLEREGSDWIIVRFDDKGSLKC